MSDRFRIVVALAALYLIWGSTYIGIRIALEGFPPLLMAGIRFVLAGAILYGVLRARGSPAPRPGEWRSSGILGARIFHRWK